MPAGERLPTEVVVVEEHTISYQLAAGDDPGTTRLVVPWPITAIPGVRC